MTDIATFFEENELTLGKIYTDQEGNPIFIISALSEEQIEWIRLKIEEGELFRILVKYSQNDNLIETRYQYFISGQTLDYMITHRETKPASQLRTFLHLIKTWDEILIRYSRPELPKLWR